MRKAILVLAFLAISVNVMGQTCWDGRQPIPCPKVYPEIIPPDRCLSCPTDFDLKKDLLYRENFFKYFLHLPFAMVATTVNVLNARQIEKVK